MLHFMHEDYYSDWNMVNIEGLSFAVLIMMQWLSITVTLQSWKEMRILNKVIEQSMGTIKASIVLMTGAIFGV